MKSLFGIQSDSTAVLVGKPVKVVDSNTASSGSTTSTASASASAATSETAQSQKDYTAVEAEGDYDNGLLIVKEDGHWRGLELFGGGTGENYINALNTLRSSLDSSVRIYSMPAPQASEFYTPSNYSEYTRSQADCFANIASQLSSGITYVDSTSELAKHTEEDIYCRTDHHWKQLGAYYAAKAFANAANVPFADLSAYQTETVTGFVGTLYATSGDSRLLNDPDDFTFYFPQNKYHADYYDTGFHYSYSADLIQNVAVDAQNTNTYLRFLGGDSQVVKVTTDVNNGRKLLVVKDSFGNAEIPCYVSSFSTIYVVDMRYFERNLISFIQSQGITDVLFTCAAYSVVGVNADNLSNLLTQNAGETIVDDAPAATV